MGGVGIDNMSTCLGKIERIVNHFGDVTNNQKMGSIDPIKVMKAFLIIPISYIGFMASTAFIAKGCDMLVKGGYDVVKATDGQEALRLAIEEQPDLVLLDLILPKLNGYQVCRQIKSTPETAHVPVVMITSKAKNSDRQWGLEQGADDYVVKPFEAEDLLEVVGRFVPVPQVD